MMADRGATRLRVTGGVRTLGTSVVDGLSARGERQALVALGEEGVDIWSYGELGDEALGHVLMDSGARHVFTTADQAGRLEKVGDDAGLREILLDVGEDDGRSW